MNGSIRRRSKGSWEIAVDPGRDEKGKRLRKFVSVKGSKAEAQKKLRELLTALDKGLPLDSSKATVGEFLETWLRDYAETNTSLRTVEGYREKIRNYVLPNIGNVPLAKLTPQHIQAIYASMMERKLSPRTALHVHRILREALAHAMKWGLLTRNVCDAVNPPKPRNKEMAALDTPDVQKFLELASASPFGPVFFLDIYTGMRRSELLGLRWTAVDLSGKTLSVTETLQRIKGKGLVAMQPKTDRSRRLVSLPPSAVALLSGLKVKQREQREAMGLEWKESDYVFSNFDGTPYHPDTVTRAFTRIIKKAGVPKVRLHDLRHTHATLMLKQGVHPKIVSERLGHASIIITLDTYSHVLPSLQEAAALKFEEMLQEPVKEELPTQ
jgi:integrase